MGVVILLLFLVLFSKYLDKHTLNSTLNTYTA